MYIQKPMARCMHNNNNNTLRFLEIQIKIRSSYIHIMKTYTRRICKLSFPVVLSRKNTAVPYVFLSVHNQSPFL